MLQTFADGFTHGRGLVIWFLLSLFINMLTVFKTFFPLIVQSLEEFIQLYDVLASDMYVLHNNATFIGMKRNDCHKVLAG